MAFPAVDKLGHPSIVAMTSLGALRNRYLIMRQKIAAEASPIEI
jgi:hypothetical protein